MFVAEMSVGSSLSAGWVQRQNRRVAVVALVSAAALVAAEPVALAELAAVAAVTALRIHATAFSILGGYRSLRGGQMI